MSAGMNSTRHHSFHIGDEGIVREFTLKIKTSSGKNNGRNYIGTEKLRQIHCLVTAQTEANLEWLAQMGGCESIGRAVDKLVREKMISLRASDNHWRHHIRGRFGRGD